MANVSNLKVLIKTGNVKKAGTDDKIWFDIGKYRWQLDNPKKNDFEKGHTDTFNLTLPAGGLKTSDIWRYLICKAPDGDSGGWNFGGLKVLVNNATHYENNAINKWIEDESVRYWEKTSNKPDVNMPNRLFLSQENIKSYIKTNLIDVVFKNGKWDNLKLKGGLTVTVEPTYIYLKQKFVASISNAPDPEVTLKAKFLPVVQNGQAQVTIISLDVSVDFPTWFSIVTLGIAEIIESKIENKIKPMIKSVLKKQLEDQVKKMLPNGLVAHVALWPKKVEVFYKL